MDDPFENEISTFKRFLERFCRDVEDPSSQKNDSPVRHVSYTLVPSEMEGESLQWALDYLCHTLECPAGLAEHVSREAYERITKLDLHQFYDNTSQEQSADSQPQIELVSLQQEVGVQVYQVCSEWNQQLPPSVRPPSAPVLPVFTHAIKNTRRKMEDRHVTVSDLNTLFKLQDSPSQSFYAVFDGHGGPEAAMFAAAQLHRNLVRDANFNSDPEQALRNAYSLTDKQFIEKAEKLRLRCGTTGVCMLVREDKCHVSWLGDSQALLVRDGRAVTIMEPHKPEREDEKRRIEELGGCVTQNFGVWRVNGNVSVSRAIGDMGQKPFLCSDADVMTFPRTGTEDYVILGCDGLWDVLAVPDIPFIVHSFLRQNPNQHSGVAKHLVLKAKEMGSSDNISVVVVFFRKDVAEPVGVNPEGFQFVRQNGEHEETSSQVSGSQQGSGDSVVSGTSRITINSSSSVPGNVGGTQIRTLVSGHLQATGKFAQNLMPGRQILSEFPCRLERQSGFFLPSLRSLRTGHRQQLIPLNHQEAETLEKASHNTQRETDIARDHNQKRKLGSKGSSKRGPPRRKLRTRGGRRKRRPSRLDSPDSTLTDMTSTERSTGDLDEDISYSLPNLTHNSFDTMHTPLFTFLQQIAEPSEFGNENDPDLLSVRGHSARLHKTLPRLPSRGLGHVNGASSSTTAARMSATSLSLHLHHRRHNSLHREQH